MTDATEKNEADKYGTWINAILNGAESDIHAPGAVDLARVELAALLAQSAKLAKLEERLKRIAAANDHALSGLGRALLSEFFTEETKEVNDAEA